MSLPAGGVFASSSAAAAVKTHQHFSHIPLSRRDNFRQGRTGRKKILPPFFLLPNELGHRSMENLSRTSLPPPCCAFAPLIHTYSPLLLPWMPIDMHRRISSTLADYKSRRRPFYGHILQCVSLSTQFGCCVFLSWTVSHSPQNTPSSDIASGAPCTFLSKRVRNSPLPATYYTF